jgi:hypothetical protein
MSVLRVVIAAAKTDGIGQGEKAIDGYVDEADTPQMKSGALNMLDSALSAHWKVASGAQLDTVNVLIDYVEHKRRELLAE